MSSKPASPVPSGCGADPPCSGSRFFLALFLALVLLGIGTVALLHLVLERRGLLPPPPLTATDCIDGKFAALRDAPLSDRTLVAVGSSATWRNLDMLALERRIRGSRAYNAAPCYLHIDQTAFLAEFLLQRMPQVDTLLTVVAPRDFETCPDAQRAFFDMDLADAYLAGVVPRWLPYVTGFRPIYLAREALKRRADPPRDANDPLGSSILRTPHLWRPEPILDHGCYVGLARLEEIAVARGIRLVVAILPAMPEWVQTFDPDRKLLTAWSNTIRSTLKRPETVLADGMSLDWDNSRFADPVHLLYPHHTPFTDFVAEEMQRRAQSLAVAW